MPTTFFAILDDNLRIRWISEPRSGYTLPQTIGRRATDFYDTLSAVALAELFAKVGRTGRPGTAKLRAAAGTQHCLKTVFCVHYATPIHYATTTREYDPDLDYLTPRQLDIARELARGKTLRAAANHMKIAENTARTHVERIRETLHLEDMTDFITWIADHREVLLWTGEPPPETRQKPSQG